jgi:putative transcriptional regulator
MTAKTKYRSRISRTVHEAAAVAYKAGVMDKTTMREFDERCLVPARDLTPGDILAIREQECVSQAVLARHLDVTTGLVSQWERGERHPSGPALTLLSLIKRKGLAILTN